MLENLLNTGKNRFIRKYHVPKAQQKETEKELEAICQKLAVSTGYEQFRVIPKCSNVMNGNMARAAFKNPELLADITGLPKDYVEGLANVWTAIRTFQPIDWVKFKNYCDKVKALYFHHKLDYYPMSPTTHKLLEHGYLYFKNAPCPLGYMSEEPLESNNKWLRFYREFFARNFSREENMYDMFMRCYYMSDPRIREIIMKWRKIKDSDDFMELPDAVKGLLVTKS